MKLNSKVLEFGALNVLEASQKRIAYLFDQYDNIQLSFSGGKDSTVLFYLMEAEAKKRGRKFYLYFQDQEAEYQATIDLVEKCMNSECVIPLWFQVPIFMTNAVSHEQLFLYAWGEGEQWVREKNPIAIKEIKEQYPRRFYKFNHYVAEKLASREGKSVVVVGLRGEESPDRYMVMATNKRNAKHFWIRNLNAPHTAYPIIDWSYTDVWKYLIENKLRYNETYDKLYRLGRPLKSMRVSNLIHEKAYNSLADLQVLEPETYDKLEQRLKGVHCGAMYARENLIYSTKKLPSKFANWKEYKDFLLSSIHPDLRARFEKTGKNDSDKNIVKRVLLCDWEGSLKSKAKEQEPKKIEKWLNL